MTWAFWRQGPSISGVKVLSPGFMITTPTLEPSSSGLTTKGRGSGSALNSSFEATTLSSATGTPAAAQTRLAMGLFMATDEAMTPEWV